MGLCRVGAIPCSPMGCILPWGWSSAFEALLWEIWGRNCLLLLCFCKLEVTF